MRIFVTGATGFIGSALLPLLVQAGHEVTGLTRTQEGAERLEKAGAKPVFGDIFHPQEVARNAVGKDAVIHLAFSHDDWSKMVENCEADRKLIIALGEALGPDKILIITSGVAVSQVQGRPITEEDPPNVPFPRVASEQAGEVALANGADVRVVRLPQVHDPLKQGLITPLALIAKEKGFSAYVGDGQATWPAAHLSDVALLYKLVLEKGEKGKRYNAVGEAGVKLKDIAEELGKGLGVPVKSIPAEEAQAHFGWFAALMAHSMEISNRLTRERLGWNPTGPSLMADLAKHQFAGT